MTGMGPCPVPGILNDGKCKLNAARCENSGYVRG